MTPEAPGKMWGPAKARDAVDPLWSALITKQITLNAHSDGLAPEIFEQNPTLKRLCRLLSVNDDDNVPSIPFVSSFEFKDYPFYATQFHAEKNNFVFGTRQKSKVGEVGSKSYIPHGPISRRLSTYLAEFFVDDATQNTHKFADFADLDRRLIYNFVPIRDPKGIFELIYRWPQPKVTVIDGDVAGTYDC